MVLFATMQVKINNYDFIASNLLLDLGMWGGLHLVQWTIRTCSAVGLIGSLPCQPFMDLYFRFLLKFLFAAIFFRSCPSPIPLMLRHIVFLNKIEFFALANYWLDYDCLHIVNKVLMYNANSKSSSCYFSSCYLL